MKLRDLLSQWLSATQWTVKPRTAQHYQHIITSHINSYFGNAKLRSLTKRDMQQYMAYLATDGNTSIGCGLSSSSIQLILSVLRQGLQYGIDNCYIADNPLAGIRNRHAVGKVVGSFTQDEHDKITMFASTNRRYFGVILALYTGIRIGELLALQWDDFDQEQGILHISKTTFMLKDNSGTWCQVTDCPKTASSHRDIPIPPKINKLLLQHRAGSSSQYIIDNNGAQMKVRHYQFIFESMLKKLSIPQKGFHALRHTFASRAIELGVDVKTLSELLGHSKTSITLDRYVHTNLGQKKKAIGLISNSIRY